MPCRRWGHTSVMYEKFMYIYGGHGLTDKHQYIYILYNNNINNKKFL